MVRPSCPALVIHDDDAFRKTLIATLDERNFTVTFATDGDEAVGLLTDRKFNVVILGVNLGSGAGLPGIPLALARPDLTVTLLEPLARRVAFLTECVRRLALERVTVVRGRAEDGPIRRQLGGADVVTARAVAPLDKLAGWCLPLLRPGGLLLAMKGSTAAAELAAAGPLPGAADALVTQAGDPPATVIVVTRGTVRATARGGRAR